MDSENNAATLSLAENVHNIINEYVAQAIELELKALELDEAAKNPTDYTAININLRYREVASGIWIRVERLQKIVKHL